MKILTRTDSSLLRLHLDSRLRRNVTKNDSTFNPNPAVNGLLVAAPLSKLLCHYK